MDLIIVFVLFSGHIQVALQMFCSYTSVSSKYLTVSVLDEVNPESFSDVLFSSFLKLRKNRYEDRDDSQIILTLNMRICQLNAN